AYALRRQQTVDDFLERFQELILLERRGFPDDHPFRIIHAMPDDIPLPPIWLLGSSDYSAQVAALMGFGFSFAHHFSDHDATGPMLSYRSGFKASATLQQPYAILACAVVCADSDAEAERLAATVDLNWVLRARGQRRPLASPEDALAFPYTPADRAHIRQRRSRLFVGAPGTVRPQLAQLMEATKADEVMVTTMIYDHGARRRSYELLAQAFELTSP